MSQGESNLSRKIMDGLRADGHFCYKNHGGPMMMSGLPDIMVCAGGLFIGLETKKLGKHGNTSARQDFVRDQIRSAGGIYEVVVSLADARRVVARALR